MALLISKANDKNQTIVTINGLGVYFQELRLGDRPQSPRVRIGKLVVLEGEGIVVEYDAINDYEDLIVKRETEKKVLNAALSLMSDDTADSETLASRQANVRLSEKTLKGLRESIDNNPVSLLTAFNVATMQHIDKLLDKVRYRHKHIESEDKSVKFTHYPSRQYFLHKAAEELLIKHNESLEARGVETGYLDFDSAFNIILKRYSKATTPATTTTTPATTTTTPVTTTTKKTRGKKATPATL